MEETKRTSGVGGYANVCLTIIAGCLLFLCYRMTATHAVPMRVQVVAVSPDLKPTQVELVSVATNLTTPIPCKLMYKKESSYSLPRTQWTDEGALHVHLVDAGKPQQRMQVEIVDVAANIQNALPVTAQRKQGGLFGVTASDDEPIAVRLVGIERPSGHGKWHAIPVRGPAPISGELGGLIGSYPVKVEVEP